MGGGGRPIDVRTDETQKEGWNRFLHRVEDEFPCGIGCPWIEVITQVHERT